MSLENDRQRELINLLRSHGVDKHVELPQIAVMGDTSSGKSSVLSALSGIQFPSSDRLCTRCPTQLQLKNASIFRGSVYIQRYESNKNTSSNGNINSNNQPSSVPQTKQIFSLVEITRAIQEMTDTIIREDTGTTITISDDREIVIRVEGPDLPNLTLIDLPGLVRAVGDGEDATLIPRVRALVQRYLVQERTIILAVVPGNVDMHNTEILHMAKEVDPMGHRTISVLTKLDLVDKGAERSVIDLLENRTKSLKLGYHAVRCRGQFDVTNGVNIEQGLLNENTFFNTHGDWSRVSKKLVGTVNLKQKLSNLLEEHIEKALPFVQTEICRQLDTCQADLVDLGPAMQSTSERRRLFEKSLRTLEQSVVGGIKGTYHGPFFDHHSGAMSFREDDDNPDRDCVNSLKALDLSLPGAMKRNRDYDSNNSDSVEVLFSPSSNNNGMFGGGDTTVSPGGSFNIGGLGEPDPRKPGFDGAVPPPPPPRHTLEMPSTEEFDPRLRSSICGFERSFRDYVSKTRVNCYGNIRKGDMVFWHKDGKVKDPVGMEAIIVTDVDATDGSYTIELSEVWNLKAARQRYPAQDGIVTFSDGKVYRLTGDKTGNNGKEQIKVKGLRLAQISYPTARMVEMLNENRGEQLSIFPNYVVFTQLVSSYCREWHAPMQKLTLQTRQAVQAFLKKAINFDLPPHPRYRKAIEQRVLDFSESCFSDMEHAMATEMKLESDHPSTLNHYLYDTLIKLRTKPLIQTFTGMADADGKIDVEHALSVLKNYGVGLKSNQEQEAIEMQFALAAYMKVAKKRFIDSIPRIVHSRFLLPLSERMIPDITLTDDELEQLLGESRSIARRRKDLMAKEKSLREAKGAFFYYDS